MYVTTCIIYQLCFFSIFMQYLCDYHLLIKGNLLTDLLIGCLLLSRAILDKDDQSQNRTVSVKWTYLY